MYYLLLEAWLGTVPSQAKWILSDILLLMFVHVDGFVGHELLWLTLMLYLPLLVLKVPAQKWLALVRAWRGHCCLPVFVALFSRASILDTTLMLQNDCRRSWRSVLVAGSLVGHGQPHRTWSMSADVCSGLCHDRTSDSWNNVEDLGCTAQLEFANSQLWCVREAEGDWKSEWLCSFFFFPHHCHPSRRLWQRLWHLDEQRWSYAYDNSLRQLYQGDEWRMWLCRDRYVCQSRHVQGSVVVVRTGDSWPCVKSSTAIRMSSSSLRTVMKFVILVMADVRSARKIAISALSLTVERLVCRKHALNHHTQSWCNTFDFWVITNLHITKY